MLLANAQSSDSTKKVRTFKPFKVDISVGYTSPKSGGSNVLFSVEPKYAICDELTLGFKIETAIMDKTTRAITSINTPGTQLSTDQSKNDKTNNWSYVATGDYYFSKDKTRAFAGIGLGVYTITTTSLTINGAENTNNGAGMNTKFGQMIRIGFETGHLRFGVEYNMIPKTEQIDPITNEQTATKNGYLGVKVGLCIGGGKISTK